VKDGAADLSETFDDENEDDENEDENEDAQGGLVQELGLQSVNDSRSQTDLKRRAGEDEGVPGVKRHKK